MRLVIDMQGAQTESRFRGIGRYTNSFVKSLIRNCGEHEIILALNGLFSDSVDELLQEYAELLPRERIKVWLSPYPVCINNA